jgi:hypothetical protein
MGGIIPVNGNFIKGLLDLVAVQDSRISDVVCGHPPGWWPFARLVAVRQDFGLRRLGLRISKSISIFQFLIFNFQWRPFRPHISARLLLTGFCLLVTDSLVTDSLMTDN